MRGENARQSHGGAEKIKGYLKKPKKHSKVDQTRAAQTPQLNRVPGGQDKYGGRSRA